MQLDLLQKEPATAPDEKKTATAKKSKLPGPELVSEVAVDGVFPPLPESLRASFILEKHGHEGLEKAPEAFKTISETARFLDVPQHVLRFWESRFSQIKPLKLQGGRRYYRPDDIDILVTIKNLLYKQGYTIKGAKKLFSSQKKARLPLGQGSNSPHAISNNHRALEQNKHQLTTVREELLQLRDLLKSHIL